MAVSLEVIQALLDAEVLWPTLTTAKREEKLDGFLTDAGERAELDEIDAEDVDAATIAWVRYRAFSEVYDRMLMLPASVTAADEGSSQYSSEQIAAMRERRDEALAEYQDLTPAEDAETEQTFSVIQSLR